MLVCVVENMMTFDFTIKHHLLRIRITKKYEKKHLNGKFSRKMCLFVIKISVIMQTDLSVTKIGLTFFKQRSFLIQYLDFGLKYDMFS